jgi:hypothetical protein
MPKQTIPVRNRPETERRAWVRFPKDREVWCQPTSPSDTAWLGRVRDVSTAGIGLSMTRRFEPGTALIVELPQRHLLAHVIHATREENGRWTIGCTFDSALSQQELQKFLEEKSTGQ